MKFYSEICEAMYEEAVANYEVGAMTEAEMREMEELCIVKENEPAYEPEETVVLQHA